MPTARPTRRRPGSHIGTGPAQFSDSDPNTSPTVHQHDDQQQHRGEHGDRRHSQVCKRKCENQPRGATPATELNGQQRRRCRRMNGDCTDQYANCGANTGGGPRSNSPPSINKRVCIIYPVPDVPCACHTAFTAPRPRSIVYSTAICSHRH